MSKYTELVGKFVKEEEGNKVELAVKNSPVLKARLQAKLQALKAEEMEKDSELKELEGSVEKAQALVTTDVNVWIEGVREAEEARDNVADEISDIQASIEKFEEWIKLF